MMLLLFMMVDLALASAGEPSLDFLDPCSSNPIGYTTSKALRSMIGRPRIRIKWTGLKPGTKVWLSLKVAAKSRSQEIPILSVTDSRRADSEGEIEIVRKVSMNETESKENLLSAQMSWVELSSQRRAGVRSTYVIVIPGSKPKAFYRLVSPELCRWETPVSIASEYQLNTAESYEFITKEEEDIFSKGQGTGIDLGPSIDENESTAGKLPGDSKTFFGGYVFAQWQQVLSEQTNLRLKRRWTLAPGDGAYFGLRLTFVRYRGQEFREYSDENGCSVLRKDREGLIDVGVGTTDLYVVPRDLSNDPQKAQAFMEKISPRLNTCGENLPSGALEFTAPGSFDGRLFFYPNSKE